MRSNKKGMEKIHRLSQLFDNQIEILKNLGCPKKVIDILRQRSLQDRVIGACLQIKLHPNRIPFIPVITPAHCSVDVLMTMVRNGKEKGDVYPQIMSDRYPIIEAVGSQPFLRTYFDPYYAINIEDGTRTKGVDTRKACRKILLSGRSPLTVAESISLCIQTDVLSRHYLWAAGSRWEKENKIPTIWLTSFGCTPRLGKEFIDDCHESLWGTPSCWERVG